MSLSSADIAVTPSIALEPESTGVARFRDSLAVVAMVGSNIFNVLALVGIMPVIAAITMHFAAHAQNGVVFTILGYGVGTEIASQLMITLLNIGIMFAGPLLGLVAQRAGYMRLLTVALALYAVAGSAGLYLDSPVNLLLSRLFLGLAGASISICCYSLIGDRFQGERRARMLGYQSALVMATGLIALFGAGAIADFGGWRAPFALYLLAIPMFILTLFAAHPAARRPVAGVKPAGVGSLLPMWPFYLMLVPFNLAIYMTSVHLPYVLVSDGVTKPSLQGDIMASSFLMNILASLSYGRIASRMSRRSIFILLMGIFALSDMVIGLSHNWVGSLIGVWVAGLGGGLMTPFFVNIILNRVSAEVRGAAIGFMYSMMYVGDFMNPLVITPLRQQVGNHQIFAVMGVILIGAVLIQTMSRKTPLGVEQKLATR